MVFLIILYVVFSSYVILVTNWELDNLGINYNYYVSSIAIYRNRAFLSVPRNVCNNNISQPTLIEVHWNGEHKSISFFNKAFHSQEWGDCEDVQNAVSLDLEPKKFHLWVLDKGNKKCSAKIVAYNLFQNAISHSCELSNIPKRKLNSIIIDPLPADNGYKAYVGEAGDNTLLVFSLSEMKWWRLNLRETSLPVGLFIHSEFLAVSKIKPILYMTGKETTELFSLSLENVRESEGPLAIDSQQVFIETNVSLLGNKLGISTGLISDVKGGLTYYLIRDYAVVRWDTQESLQAEYHDVLGQSFEKLPYVSQLFRGPHEGIWALVNPVNPDICNSKDDIESSNLESRVFKILKYNKNLL